MQPETTSINHERVPYKLSVFLFGNEDTQKTRCLKQFHRYNHEQIGTGYSMDEDDSDDELILSGRILFISCL